MSVSELAGALLATLLAMSLAQAAPATDDTTRVAATQHFEFHSDPWLNAHHFLYQWSRDVEGIGEGRSKVSVPERDSLHHLSADEQTTWTKSIDFYRSAVAKLDHFDDRMLAQKIGLLRVAGDTSATPQESIDGLIDALQSAMPIYLRYWWRAHDQENRRWSQEVATVVVRHENRFVELTERIYAAHWLTDRRRIDVSAYANFRAGYTAMGHTVIFSTDEGNQGLYGVETLFHEVQHARDVAGNARSELRDAFGEAGVNVPDNLWHAIIFDTAGAFVQTIAAQENLGPYIPYATREGFAGFSGWREAMHLAITYWPRVLSNEISARDAMTLMADDAKASRD